MEFVVLCYRRHKKFVTSFCNIFFSPNVDTLKFITGHMEKFLLKADQTIDMKEKLTIAETLCDVEFNGSTLWKDITVLVRKLGS